MANYRGAKGYCWVKGRSRWVVRYKGSFYGYYKTEVEAQKAYQAACSGVVKDKTKRKLYHLPTGVSKQSGKYRVRPQVNGKKIWLGQYATVQEAEKVLKQWRER
tara:strand:+ start:1684 stop:1995 length:312 start_codon:yes stop_codon:yes gene_type:complete